MPSSSSSSSPTANDKKCWWLRNRKMAERWVKEAKILLATGERNEIESALNLIESALSISPRLEIALEIKARCLLFLKRFKDVADMLQDYIPSVKMENDESGSGFTDNSTQHLLRDRMNLMLQGSVAGLMMPSFNCFSVSDLKKVMGCIGSDHNLEAHWRYLVLGEACFHLGLLEDAMALLQAGKRLLTAELRRKSISLSHDSFNVSKSSISGDSPTASSSSNSSVPETENLPHLLSTIKLLLRRKTAAIAACDAALYSEAVRHFSKIVEGRRGAPQGFLAECFLHRAFAHKSLGRVAEAIADCNKTLSLEPMCIQALETRALLLESIHCLPDSLHDFEHLKLLYNTILRDRKLPGPIWRQRNVRYREIPRKLTSLTAKIQELKQQLAAGELKPVDYHALFGLRRGCSRSELDRAYLLLCLKHKPEEAALFYERCEFVDEKDVESIKDRSKMAALLLYRLIRKGYTCLLASVTEDQDHSIADTVSASRDREETALHETARKPRETFRETALKPKLDSDESVRQKVSVNSNAFVYQGVFCRDLTIVGNLLSQVGCNLPISVKYEALSC